MTDENTPEVLGPIPPGPIDSVLLIDGDNDPHLPPDFPITERTLVRVFLRQAAKMPRGLERRVGHLPMCVPVSVEKGGANAADFAMSLHAGMLHAVLPLHLQFTMVTNDKTIQAMSQELQRIGRVTKLWSSHPMERAPSSASSGRSRRSSSSPSTASRSVRGRGRGRVRGGRGRAAAPAAAPIETLFKEEGAPLVPPPGGRAVSDVAASYLARLKRMKNPPSRLKALLNDIKNRAGVGGYTPEEVLEELKRGHGVLVDESGRVQLS